MGQLKNFSKDTIIYGLGKGLQKFVGFLLLPIYTRSLTPSDYGILDTLGTTVTFLSIFLGAGISSSCSRYFYMAKTEDEKGKVLFTSFILRAVTIIPTIFLSFFSETISIALFNTTEYTWLIFITCFTVPVSLIIDEQGWIYRFYNKAWRFNIFTLLKTIGNLSLGIILVIYLKKGIIGAQTATLLSSTITIIYSIISFSKNKYKLKFSFYWAKKMIKLGAPLIVSGILAWIYSQSDRFFLLHFQNTAEIGLYSVGQMFARPISILNMAIGMSFYPFFMSLYENEESRFKPETKKTANKIWYYYLYLSISMASVLSIFGTDLIKYVAQPEYVRGAIAIPFLAFSNLLFQSTNMISLGIILKEKTYHYIWVKLIAAIVSLSLNFILIPKYGFFGASIVILFSQLIYLLCSNYISQKLFANKFKYFKIAIYIAITFIISAFIPISEHIYNYHFYFGVKILLIIIALIIPFLINLINISDFKFLQKYFS